MTQRTCAQSRPGGRWRRWPPAVRIDRDNGHPINGRLFDEGDTQPGLAAARHAHDHAMRHQVLGIIQEQFILNLSGFCIIQPPQIKDAQFLKILCCRHTPDSPFRVHQRADWMPTSGRVRAYCATIARICCAMPLFYLGCVLSAITPPLDAWGSFAHIVCGTDQGIGCWLHIAFYLYGAARR